MFKTLGLSQFIVIIAIAVALILSWDFSRRILETVQLVQQVQAADRELAQAEAVNAKLRELKQDVTNDEWVEKTARARLHYSKDGETLFIPAATPVAPAAPAPVVVTSPPQRTFWQDILEALFGPPQ
ncbi:MAG: septum formation initiator family protein [Chloroflexi bacterium]|nr:septum formation initiator family protein [Chloroflexota bacterium]